ncbi:MAG TPA: coproporphyrinogen-III oxidase family protein [Holophagaceae bacterium]|jgi:oxygen-independent coproporphyrinogen-3 oxidase|nr:coproporphyrinogen-III oxidase family protein [Holophagaceae bacterium]
MDGLPPVLAPHLDALRTAAQAEPLGLYLHMPFCKDRCTYCSFVTTRDTALQSGAVARLITQVRAWGEALDRPALDTLYLGGGTPSLLTREELSDLTAAVREAFDGSTLEEATFEANPGTVDADWLKAARDLGWDRVSIGTQTLDDTLLAMLGRIHGGEQALDALHMAEAAGFARISADLMVGLPAQNLDRVLGDARALVGAGASHMSVYLLDLDKACPLKAEVDAGRLALPDEDAVATVFEALQTELPRLGLAPYEISNYGEPSKHNLRYWKRRPYLGIGPSAASQLADFRWTEEGNIPAWSQGRAGVEFQDLSEAETLAELPLLGLRLHEGVDWDALRIRAEALNLRPLFDAWDAALTRFQTHGLLIAEGPRRRLTERGMLLSNQILQTFV